MKLFKADKRSYLTFFLLWLALSSSPVVADELIGTVLSIDRESRQLVVAPVTHPGQGEKNKTKVKVVLPDYMVFIRPSGRLFPRWAEVGRKIGVLGEYTDNNRTSFSVRTVHPDYSGPGYDATGVRGRIGRGCRHGLTNGQGRKKNNK